MSENFIGKIYTNKNHLLDIARERNLTMKSLRSQSATPVDFDHQQAWLHSMTDSDDYYYVFSEERDCIGYCGLNDIDRINGTAEISLLIFEAYRKKYYGAYAVDELLKVAFREHKLQTVYAEVYDTTLNSVFWERCRFSIEGVLRNRKLWDGKYWDSIMMSVTEDEWE